MSPTPTGRLILTAAGRDLVLTRSFRAPIDDVWASITEPERTARWFARWEGDGAPGGTITYTLTLEAGEPSGQMTVEACEPPRRLAVSAVDEYGSWHLEARLREEGGLTDLEFVHHLDETATVGDIGPGWEYYLDALVASREGAPAPSFDDYFPAQKRYYEGLAPEGD